MIKNHEDNDICKNQNESIDMHEQSTMITRDMIDYIEEDAETNSVYFSVCDSTNEDNIKVLETPRKKKIRSKSLELKTDEKS